MQKFLILITLLFSFKAQALIVKEITPLTNQIILVKVQDGVPKYHSYGQPYTQDSILGDALVQADALNASNFSISSSNDVFYASAQVPDSIGLKSKGQFFIERCDGWGYLPAFNDIGCENIGSRDYASIHCIYIFLPQAMQLNKTYTINFSNLPGLSSTTFTYDYKVLRSDAVHVNQIGYDANSEAKYGYVYSWMGNKGPLNTRVLEGKSFYLIDSATGATVYTSTVAFRKDSATVETGQWDPAGTPNQNFVGATVYDCDFSSFTTPGTYYLSVEDVGRSYPFSLSCNAYNTPFNAVMQGIYQQRSGIALTTPYTVHPRLAPHNPLTTPGFAGKLIYTNTKYQTVSVEDAAAVDKPLWEAGFEGPINTWGWYQDAGDWDTYLTHSNVPAKLMFTYEAFQDNFYDAQLNIPESGNGIPDILDEARWQLRFYKRTKDAMAAAGYGTGGVGGARVMGDLWGGDNTTPGIGNGSWHDTARTWIVSAEDVFTTYIYAALAAQYQHCLNLAGATDPEGINWQTEAVNAYTWANTNTTINDTVLFFYNINDCKTYAATALYRLTGTASYHTAALAGLTTQGIGASTGTLENQQAYGAFIYAFTKGIRPIDTPMYQNVLDMTVATADFNLVYFINNRACRWGGNFWFPMVAGQATTPYIFEAVLAYAVQKQVDSNLAKNYLKSIQTTADYFLGNNPLNTCWISGLGEQSPEGIFSLDGRYIGDSVQQRYGIVPYGQWTTQYTYGPYGPWNNAWPHKTLFPDYTQWPGHEKWYNNRYTPLSSEYTVHQTNANAAAIYGALSCKYNTSTPLNISQVILKVNCVDNKHLIEATTSNIVNLQQLKLLGSNDGTVWQNIMADNTASITTSLSVGYTFYSAIANTSSGVVKSQVITAPCKTAVMDDVVIYPNPTTDFFTVKSSQHKLSMIQVLDAQGNTVLRQKFNTDAISLQHTNPGFYTVLLFTQDGQVISRKLVKQ
ncbi:MAG: hypothetical protein RL660_2354 [Bacteroidota bacterium]|jgi:hypothetical protein